jgi:acyl-CoA hydrolase
MERCTQAEAAARVRTEDGLGLPLGPGQPAAFLRALGERDDWKRLTVFTALLVDLFPLFARSGVRLLSGFFGPAERALRAAGHDVSFVPGDFRRFERIARQLAPRVMATCGAPLAGGRVSLSLHAGATVDELLRCGRDPERLLVVETSPRLPRTRGLPPHEHAIPEEVIDLLIEGEEEPRTLDEPAPGEVDRAIAEHVRPFIGDGSTLQTGIGAIPSRVVALLAEGDGGDYGIHSEMFTTGLMRLHQAGKVRNRKGIYDGFSIATFAFGSRELYDWLHEQPVVRFLPVSTVNDPAVIARNRQMVSINGALAVDLLGQVAADALGREQYSGIGGHEDFVAGAGLAPGDRSLVCLPSTASGAGAPISRIQAAFPAGGLVTTPRHQIDTVVTEHGVAELTGLTVRERAEALAAIAAPEFRRELAREAARL